MCSSTRLPSTPKPDQYLFVVLGCTCQRSGCCVFAFYEIASPVFVRCMGLLARAVEFLLYLMCICLLCKTVFAREVVSERQSRDLRGTPLPPSTIVHRRRLVCFIFYDFDILSYIISSDRSSCSHPLTTFSHNLLTLLKISL